MIAVNNLVRKLAIALPLIRSAALMANQRAASGRPLNPLASRASFCCRSTPSVCGDLLEVYLNESARPCLSSRSRAFLRRGSARACVRGCHNAKSPALVYQTSPKVSAVPPGDNDRDQIAWLVNRKRCCDIGRPDLGIELWFLPQSEEGLE